MTSNFTEDTLVQRTTADYLQEQLGWRSAYAHHLEDFGPGGLLGRASEREVLLPGILRRKLEALNPGLPTSAYDDTLGQAVSVGGSRLVQCYAVRVLPPGDVLRFRQAQPTGLLKGA